MVRVVRVGDQDHRDWLQAAPVCPLLAQHQIIHAEEDSGGVEFEL